MNAVAYVRVSTEDQVNGTSLDSQALACAEYAKRQSWNLPSEAIFREEGVSATKLTRPSLAELLDYCASHEDIQYCVVWKVDRLARNSAYHHLIKSKLSALGVRLVSVTEPLSDDAVGTLVESVLASIAQFDNEIRAARATSGMRVRTMQGGWPHMPTIGYKKARNESGVPILMPDEEMAPRVKAFLEQFASGDYTVTEAVELAYQRGIRHTRGGRRGFESVKLVLTNPVYAGLINTKFTEGKSIKGLHEPLISEATHYKILSIVKGNSIGFAKHADIDWPLRGGFVKHVCGTPLTGSSPRGNSGPSPRYSCPQCKASAEQPVSKMRNRVHEDFIAMLKEVKMDAGTKELYREIVLRRWQRESLLSSSLRTQQQQELDALSTKKSRLIDLYIEGKLTDTDKDAKLAQLNGSIASLQTELSTSADGERNAADILDGALMFMTQPEVFWHVGDIHIKRAVQSAIFPEGLTYDFAIGFGTPVLSSAYLLAREIGSNSFKNSSVVGVDGLEPSTKGL